MPVCSHVSRRRARRRFAHASADVASTDGFARCPKKFREIRKSDSTISASGSRPQNREIWISGSALLRVAGRSTTLRRRFVRHSHRLFGRRFRLKTGSGARGLRLGVRGRCFGGDLLTHWLIPSGLRVHFFRRKVSGGPDFGSPAPTLMGGRATFRRHVSRYRRWPFQMRFRLKSGPRMRESGGFGLANRGRGFGDMGRASADVGCTGGIPIALQTRRIRKLRFQGMGDASRREVRNSVAPPFSTPPSAVPEGGFCENRGLKLGVLGGPAIARN